MASEHPGIEGRENHQPRAIVLRTVHSTKRPGTPNQPWYLL